MHVGSPPLKHGSFGIAFWMDFEALEIWFWSILNASRIFFWLPHRIWRRMREALQVEGLTLRIRATRGRSTERQRDRETERQRDRERADLILWRTRETVAKLWGPLTSDGFLAICIASWNKLRLTSLWESIFKDFGRFGEANLEGKIDFWKFFSMFFSRLMLASIFYRFSEARNVKNSNFASTGARFS